MMTMTVRDAVVRYLDQANLMQIATFVNDRPWCATVFFATDNLHNLYWLSPPHAVHSRDIEHNTQVAGAITLPHEYGQSPQGLQFEGVARQVPMQQTQELFQAYAERFIAHNRLDAILSGEDENRLYQITPTRFVLYDEEHFPAEPRQEWRVGTPDPEPSTVTEPAAEDAPADETPGSGEADNPDTTKSDQPVQSNHVDTPPPPDSGTFYDADAEQTARRQPYQPPARQSRDIDLNTPQYAPDQAAPYGSPPPAYYDPAAVSDGYALPAPAPGAAMSYPQPGPAYGGYLPPAGPNNGQYGGYPPAQPGPGQPYNPMNG